MSKRHISPDSRVGTFTMRVPSLLGVFTCLLLGWSLLLLANQYLTQTVPFVTQEKETRIYQQPPKLKNLHQKLTLLTQLLQEDEDEDEEEEEGKHEGKEKEKEKEKVKEDKVEPVSNQQSKPESTKQTSNVARQSASCFVAHHLAAPRLSFTQAPHQSSTLINADHSASTHHIFLTDFWSRVCRLPVVESLSAKKSPHSTTNVPTATTPSVIQSHCGMATCDINELTHALDKPAACNHRFVQMKETDLQAVPETASTTPPIVEHLHQLNVTSALAATLASTAPVYKVGLFMTDSWGEVRVQRSVERALVDVNSLDPNRQDLVSFYAAQPTSHILPHQRQVIQTNKLWGDYHPSASDSVYHYLVEKGASNIEELSQLAKYVLGPTHLEIRLIGPEAHTIILSPSCRQLQHSDSSVELYDCVYTGRYSLTLPGEYDVYVHVIHDNYAAWRHDYGRQHAPSQSALLYQTKHRVTKNLPAACLSPAPSTQLVEKPLTLKDVVETAPTDAPLQSSWSLAVDQRLAWFASYAYAIVKTHDTSHSQALNDGISLGPISLGLTWNKDTITRGLLLRGIDLTSLSGRLMLRSILDEYRKMQLRRYTSTSQTSMIDYRLWKQKAASLTSSSSATASADMEKQLFLDMTLAEKELKHVHPKSTKDSSASSRSLITHLNVWPQMWFTPFMNDQRYFDAYWVRMLGHPDQYTYVPYERPQYAQILESLNGLPLLDRAQLNQPSITLQPSGQILTQEEMKYIFYYQKFLQVAAYRLRHSAFNLEPQTNSPTVFIPATLNVESSLSPTPVDPQSLATPALEPLDLQQQANFAQHFTEKCLSGKRITIIGCSHSRYAYDALIRQLTPHRNYVCQQPFWGKSAADIRSREVVCLHGNKMAASVEQAPLFRKWQFTPEDVDQFFISSQHQPVQLCYRSTGHVDEETIETFASQFMENDLIILAFGHHPLSLGVGVDHIIERTIVLYNTAFQRWSQAQIASKKLSVTAQQLAQHLVTEVLPNNEVKSFLAFADSKIAPSLLELHVEFLSLFLSKILYLDSPSSTRHLFDIFARNRDARTTAGLALNHAMNRQFIRLLLDKESQLRKLMKLPAVHRSFDSFFVSEYFDVSLLTADHTHDDQHIAIQAVAQVGAALSNHMVKRFNCQKDLPNQWKFS